MSNPRKTINYPKWWAENYVAKTTSWSGMGNRSTISETRRVLRMMWGVRWPQPVLTAAASVPQFTFRNGLFSLQTKFEIFVVLPMWSQGRITGQHSRVRLKFEVKTPFAFGMGQECNGLMLADESLLLPSAGVERNVFRSHIFFSSVVHLLLIL